MLTVSPVIGRRGEIADNPSPYSPDERTRERFKELKRDFELAERIRSEPYEEFNNRDLITYMNESQQAFNSYVPSQSADPDEAWRANTVRPITRNKIISIAAHITAAILHPNIIAQNDNDDEDRDAALVMGDLMDYSNNEADYDRTMVYSVIAALVNPVTIIHEGFQEVMREVKEIQADGSWQTEKILDEIFSGFQNNIVPVDEFYIGDVYEHDIQKQPFVIWRRVINYSNAKLKYGDNENFKKYVRPGLRVFYTDEQDSFYERYDDNMADDLVEEVVYYNRQADLELTILNGILISDPDQPNRRIDKNYPFAVTGYELIDEGRFFYFKSLADKLKDDQKVMDTLYNMVLDGSFLKLMPPSIVFGTEEVDSSVITPGTITTFREDTRFQPIDVGSDLNAGLAAINQVERSMFESSTDPLQSGQSLRGAQTAFEIARLEQNAKTVLGLFGKMIAFLIEDFGKLRLSSILQFMTVGDVMETTSEIGKLRFKNVLVPDRTVDGKKMSRRIDFELELPAETEEMEFALMQEEEEKGIRIVKVNPNLFKKLKYKVQVDADFKMVQSEAVRKALNLEAYDRAIQNPIADQEAVLREFLLEVYRPGEADKFIRKSPMGGLTAPAKSDFAKQIVKAGARPQVEMAV